MKSTLAMLALLALCTSACSSTDEADQADPNANTSTLSGGGEGAKAEDPLLEATNASSEKEEPAPPVRASAAVGELGFPERSLYTVADLKQVLEDPNTICLGRIVYTWYFIGQDEILAEPYTLGMNFWLRPDMSASEKAQAEKLLAEAPQFTGMDWMALDRTVNEGGLQEQFAIRRWVTEIMREVRKDQARRDPGSVKLPTGEPEDQPKEEGEEKPKSGNEFDDFWNESKKDKPESDEPDAKE